MASTFFFFLFSFLFFFLWFILKPHKSLSVVIDSYTAFIMISYGISSNFKRTKILNFLQKILLNAGYFPKAFAHWWLFSIQFSNADHLHNSCTNSQYAMPGLIFWSIEHIKSLLLTSLPIRFFQWMSFLHQLKLLVII